MGDGVQFPALDVFEPVHEPIASGTLYPTDFRATVMKNNASTMDLGRKARRLHRRETGTRWLVSVTLKEFAVILWMTTSAH